MTDSNPRTTDDCTLRDFTVTVDWHTPQPTEYHTITARSAEDAKEVAAKVFWRSHTKSCSLDAVTVIDGGDT